MGVTGPNPQESMNLPRSAVAPTLSGFPADKSKLLIFRSVSHMTRRQLSPWCVSPWKRALDVTCVLLSMPVTLPLLLGIGLLLRVTSRGPVFVKQQRVGRFGKPFSMYRFRTTMHAGEVAALPGGRLPGLRLTRMGRFLKKWKLHALPMLINVLNGTMSLVGPRPERASRQLTRLACRPGMTGAATIAFAREADLLASIPAEAIGKYYEAVVLPAKHCLDLSYVSQATFRSDMKLLVASLLRRWNASGIESILFGEEMAGIMRPKPGSAVSPRQMELPLAALLASFSHLSEQ